MLYTWSTLRQGLGPGPGGGNRRDGWLTAAEAQAARTCKARTRAEEEDSDAFSDDDDDDGIAINDVRTDDTKIYQEKVGRYRARVSSVLQKTPEVTFGFSPRPTSRLGARGTISFCGCRNAKPEVAREGAVASVP